MSSLGRKASLPFTDEGVRDYEKRRYRSLDQRIVQAREMKIVSDILKNSAPLSPPLLLDVPCGYGRFSSLLSERGYLVSSDFSAAMVRRAVARQGGSGPPAGVVADARGQLPFRKNTFGLVFSFRLFHHLQSGREEETVLRELGRVAAGKIVVSFYRMSRIHRLQRRFLRKFRPRKRDIRMISLDDFRRSATAAGLRLIRIFPLLRGIHAQHVALLEKGERDGGLARI